jgi:cation diffusion facilitator CzcD-associated flavoprotein CzcO
MSDTPLTALIIGAGFAGICAGVKLREAGIDDFLIVEKTKGISGTWYDNSYPGAACDVPSHLYSFSFKPNPDWSRRFSPSDEIRGYAEDVVKDYSLGDKIQHDTEIISAKFDSAQALWKITSKDGQVFSARFLITSVAILGTPSLPDIKGMDDFSGESFHTARWPKEMDVTGKRVALIGSAASALQITPVIAKQVRHLTMFQRTANYVIGRQDRPYRAFEKWMFRHIPFAVKLPRLFIYLYLELLFYRNFKQGSVVNAYLTKVARKKREKEIPDADLRQKLTPDYPIGCKRVLLSDDYYQAFARDNVSLETGAIKRVSKNGVELENGDHIDADVIVYATGFKATEFLPNLDLHGINGAELTTWRKHPLAYKGLVIEDMPNAYFLLGPNTGLGHSSMILMIEAQVRYLVRQVKSLPKGQYIVVNKNALDSYNQYIQENLAKTVWATGCQSWYKTEDGTIPTLWPFPTYTYARMMKKPDVENYTICQE